MGEYVQIGPVKTWYESAGGGQPLVLLHGDLTSNDTWAGQMETLAAHFRVLAPERRGHGHTPDVDAPITYELLAEDTVRFLETVVGGPAHLVGWSGGANVGLIVALTRPDLVNKLVLISANADVAGCVPEFLAAARLPADSATYAPFREMHAATSPDGPEHWPAIFSKMTQLWLTEPNIPRKDLARVHARTLVMAADDDVVALEHTISLYRSIPGAELAIVPGTSHGAPLEKPELVNGLLLDFLGRDAIPTMMPIRRAPTLESA